MKRHLLKLLALVLVGSATSYALSLRPRTVQGVEYTPRQVQGVEYTPQKSGSDIQPKDYEWYIPEDMPAPDGEFTFDMIKFWAGEGENRAALVIQWNYEEEQNALVFGYRWDGLATGADMIRAVVSAYPRLYGLIQYTNVSSPTDPNGGYTINGFGWDSDNDGDIALIDTKDNQVYESPDGLFIHPRGYDPAQGGSSDYDYDDWIARDEDDLWGAGWYLSYWSYWVKDDYASPFSYSGWGASGRVLEDGSWDGWNFSLNMKPCGWKEFVAAPALIPEGAKTEFEYQGICYSLTDYTAKRVKVVAPFEGVAAYSGNIDIPSTFVDGEFTYNVTEIGDDAFAGCKDITTVNLPTSVKKVGKRAFSNSGLNKLSVDNKTGNYDGITSMGIGAFAGTHITEPVLPSAIKAIPDSCFYATTSISGLDIPEYIETIGASAFEKSAALSIIKIPATVKTIGNRAFNGCEAITDVLSMSTTPLAIDDDVFGDVSEALLVVPDGYIDAYKAAAGWSRFGNFMSQTIPVNTGDIFKTNGMTYRVTSTAADNKTVAATYCKIEGKPTKDLITAANKAGYTGNITIPANVTYQQQQFAVTELNDSVFYGASELASVSIEAPVAKISACAFYDCTKLTDVELPASITAIDKHAFAYAGITSLELPEGITSLGERAFFQATNMAKINIPASVTTVGDNCFSYAKSLEAIELGDNITSLGTTVFQNCTSLRSVKLPSGLTKLPAYIFSSCTALTDLELPAGITEIGASAFKSCSNLPIVLPASVTTIGTEAFSGCLKITEFTFPANITSIPNYVLNGCTNLTKVTMSDNVTTIGSNSFRNCSSLKTFDFPSKLTSIGTYGFAGCALDSIVLPEGLTTINTNAFVGCTSLKSIQLPEGLTTINANAFDGCTSLKSIQLPESLKTLGGYSLRKTGLTSLVIPAACTSLTGADIINGCTDITVYACNTNPGTCGSYTWRTATNVFAKIVVPTGTQALYEAKNYWKKSELTSPEMTGVTVTSVTTAAPAARSAGLTVTGTVALSYNISDLPAQFARANDAYLLKDFTATIKVGETTVEATIDPATGTFTATVPADATEATLVITDESGDAFTSENFAIEEPAAPSPVNEYVDFSKIEYTVGEGDLHGAVMISWNDTQRGVDHLVWGVNFSAGDKPADIIKAVVEADSRLYELAEGGYAYDVLDKGEIKQQYDHYATNTTDSAWMTFSDHDPVDGSVIYLTYAPRTHEEPSAPEYTFCIPAIEKLGAWIPEGYQCPLADNTEFPVWARVGAYGLKNFTVTFSPSRPMTPTTTGAIGAKNAEGYAMIYASVYSTFKDRYEPSFYNLNVKISVSPKVNSPEGLETSYGLKNDISFPMSFVEPQQQITKLIDTEVPVAGKMSAAYLRELMQYEPANATYTDMDLYTLDGEKIDMDFGYYFLGDGTKYYAWNRKLEIESGADSQMFEVRSRLNPEITGLIYFNVNSNPVTDVYLDGIDDEVIELTVHDILAMSPMVTPAEASNTAVALSIENASADKIATAYPVGGSKKFTELVTYYPGEFDLVLTSQENANITRRYHVIVNDLDATPAGDNYEDGTFWLNEEWFTHKNGSINYLVNPVPMSEDEFDIIYRAFGAQNGGEGFGATSQYAMIFADKLFVMSKQAHDAGDIRGIPGGRVTVADAHTLKRLAQFDEIGGDGRACVGVSAYKAYVGHNAGIRVLTWDDDNNFVLSSTNIPGINNDTQSGSTDIGNNQALYNKQIGEMVRAGKYVFAIQQAVGIHIIDTDTDQCIHTIDDEGVQGIVTGADGHVWYASTSGIAEKGTTLLHEIDAANPTEELQVVTVPGSITCSWGSWRATNFFAAQSSNTLFWTTAGSDLQSSGSTIYRWDIGSDPESLEPLMSMPRQEGMTSDVTRITYASMRYDDRNDVILLATTTAPSGNYRWNWYNFVNASTGELVSSVPLKPYYWFPALPVFPDKYAPEFDDIEPVIIPFNESQTRAAAESHTFTVNAYDADAHHPDDNVRVSHSANDELSAIADVEVNGRDITVMPKAAGSASLTLVAESNGRTTSVNVPVTIGDVSSITDATAYEGTITVTGNRVRVRNLAGTDFIVFDTAGRAVSGFRADSADATVVLAIPAGTYVLTSADGTRSMKFAVK